MHNVREAFAAAPTPTPSAMPSAAPKASFKIPAQEKIRRTDQKMEPGLERSYNRGEPQGRSCKERGIQGKHIIATAFFV